MRALYTRLAILFTSFIFAQSFHDTQGKLEISSSGQSTYTLPIALPATLMNVAPTINLYYASGLSGGIAGQGWNLNSISNISRIASRIDIDGLKDGVDFDGNDKLALDGQRLILKSGTYWASGSVYETEVQSNTKIEQVGSGTSIYFVVTGPDGSRSWYGNFGGQSAMDVTAWYIVRFEDIHGNFMTYHYNKPFNKSLCISEIRFSANTATNPTPLNKIVFSYTLAARNETAYLNGQLIEKVELLNKVEVFTNGLLFKKYQLTHTTDVQGYQRLTQIQEFNGANEAANPVTFEYHTTSGVTTENLKPYTDALSLTTAPSKSGDFDGDGRLDFVTGNQLFTKLFTGTTETPPITMPMNSPPYVVNTTYLGKMLQSDAFMAVVYPDDQTMQFKTWGMATPGSISVLNTKNIPINTFASITPITMTTSPYNYDCYAYVQNNRSEFLPQINVALREGDYDGDGLTDAILIRPPLDYTANIWADYDYQGPFSPPMVNSYCNISVSPNDLPTYFWVDLDPAASTTLGSQGYKQLTDTAGVLWSGSIYKADFNGDGRTDLLSFQPNGSYKVADLNLTGSTVVTNLLGQGTIPEFNPASSNIIYFGDFNGDGKTDFIKPQGNNSGCNSCTLWDIYFANVNPAGGVAFSKSSYDITTFWPYSGSTYDEQWQSNTYYVMDINKDGKSDLVRFWAKTYQASPIADPNDIDSQWKIFAFVNNIGYTGGFTQFYASTLNHDSDDNSLPVSIAADYKLNNGLEADLAVVRYHGANSFPRYTTFIDFNKDFEQDNLLKKVRQSNDAIVDEISYQPMEPTTGTNNLGALSDFYSSSEEALYPFVEIKRVATNRLVSLLKNTSLGVVKYQAFKYHGLVFRLDGQGIVGFKKTGRSTWYRTSSDKRTWAVTETDFQKRGATIRSYQKLITGSTNFAFQTTYTTGLVTKTENTYTESTDPVSQRYVLLLNTQTTTDYLTNIKVETTYNSYSTDYFLPLSVTSKNYSGATLHGSRDVVTTYDSNPTGSGNSYYIGHVTEVNTTLKTYVNTPSGGTDTKTANEKYYYTNGDLTKTEKKANASSETLVEELAYFSNGLPQSKTSSALGTNSQTAVSSRTVAYTYDTTNRFVKTTTNPDGLITTNVSYHSLYGNVLSETNIFGQATTYEYDNWGKKIKSTDFLGKSVTYTYSRTGNVFKVAEIKDDGKSTFTESDALARQTRKATTDINGNWVYSDTTYDFLGRKTGESQPYFSTSSPSLWTTYQYDDYSRVNKTTLSTGKIVTTTYSGLTTTTSDSVMTKAKTMNANGKVVTATDTPGGTITYRFDASGNMTHMIYGGNITKMDYDNWGRKVSLQDPTAGNYTYSYNAYGESISETTPNGTIKYTLDSNGRLTIKEISGTNTNTKASYTYDPTTKLLTYIKFEDFIGGYYEEMTYEYDANKMPWRTNENRFLAFHQRATLYDAFGRPERELFSAVNTTTGKQTSKWIRNTYKNGYLWQILDDATSQVLWQTNATDPLGNLTSGSLGNAVVVSNSFDGNGYPLIFRNDRVGSNPGNVSILESNFDVARGNLMSRTNNLFNRSESFQYDSLDRLTSYPDAYGNTITQSY
ncbi:MAG TPA: FG-GAP-like repeat-containing protein, partial [Flavobacterium sp.]|nr:FG-GAP-like repeat-containing protein [Flavobacterium sp.]